MATRPLLVYDGDCAFCSSCVEFARKRIADPSAPQWDTVPFQFADLAALDARAGGRGLVSRARAEQEVLWLAAHGRVYGGAEAVAQLLVCAGGAWAVVGAVLKLPPARWAAPGVYRLIARNRHRMPGGTPACALPPPR